MRHPSTRIIATILLAFAVSASWGTLTAFALDVHGTVKASDIADELTQSDRSLVLTGDTTLAMDSALSLASIAPEKGESHGLTITGNGKLTVKGSGDVGISAKSLAVKAKSLNVSGKKAAIQVKGSLSIDKSLGIASPEGGKVSADGKTIVNAKGATAKSVEIREAAKPAEAPANDDADAKPAAQETQSPAAAKAAAPAAQDAGNAAAPTRETTNAAPQNSQQGTTATNTQNAPVATQESSFTVTFDANGHGTAPDPQTVDENATATEPAEPSEDNYTFGGWFMEADCTTPFDFSTPITADITLFAKWTENVHTHTLVKVPAVAATCEKGGSIEYWRCSDCGKLFSDEAASKEIAASSVATKALGHNWGAWTVTKKATATKKGQKKRVCKNDSSHVQTKAIPATGQQKATYSFAKNTPDTWTKGSKKALEFTVNRSKDNKKAYSHFKSIEIDGKKLDAKYYTAKSGSLKASIKAERLEQLSIDSHTITVKFDDGSAKTTVKIVKATPANNSNSSSGNAGQSGTNGNKAPATGDMIPIAILVGIAVIAAIVVAVSAIARKRQSDQQDS